MTVDPVAAERNKETLGLSGSLHERYASSIARLVHGDFGRTVAGFRIADIMMSRLKASGPSFAWGALFIVSCSMIVGFVRCSPGCRRGTSQSWSSLMSLSLIPPIMIAGLVKAILVWSGADAILHMSPWFNVVLGLAGACGAAALIVYAVIQAADDISAQPYVLTMQSIGMHPARIRLRLLHIALIMSRHVFARALMQLVSGIVFCEVVFDFPGFGLLFAEAFLIGDYNLLQAWMIIVGAVILLLSALESVTK